MTNIDSEQGRGYREDKPTRRGQAGSVATHPTSEFAVPIMTDDDEFLALNEGQVSTTQEVVDEEGNKTSTPASTLKKRAQSGQWNREVSVTHSNAGRVQMWKKTPDGWMPRPVDRNAVKTLLAEGWQSFCGDCGRKDHGPEINDCPARPQVKFAVCDICGIRVYDSYQQLPVALKAVEDSADDPNLLVFDEIGNSTPASRIRQAMVNHMWYKHPRSSSERNISEPVQPPIELMANLAARRGN